MERRELFRWDFAEKLVTVSEKVYELQGVEVGESFEDAIEI
jgi:hypothetical protein